MYLYHYFKDYSSLMIPYRHACARAKPPVFRNFKNIRCIINCTEFCYKMPMTVKQFPITPYHCTMTCLIPVFPSGGVCFISNLYEGSTDDAKMFSECGILKYINAGDAVMVDKGFSVQELLHQCRYQYL